MKTLAFFLCLSAFALNANCQKFVMDLPTDNNGKLNFNDVISVENTPADELFQKSLHFISTTLGNPNEAISYLDEENKRVEAYVIFPFDYIDRTLGIYQIHTYIRIAIEAREGRVRYQIHDISFKNTRTDRTYYPSELFTEENYYNRLSRPKHMNERFFNNLVVKVAYVTSMLSKSLSETNLDEEW